jgi:hypothetical protein
MWGAFSHGVLSQEQLLRLGIGSLCEHVVFSCDEGSRQVHSMSFLRVLLLLQFLVTGFVSQPSVQALKSFAVAFGVSPHQVALVIGDEPIESPVDPVSAPASTRLAAEASFFGGPSPPPRSPVVVGAVGYVCDSCS